MGDTAPLVSFVIATHNRPLLLERAIRSVVAQGSQAEIIVIADEGSADTRAAAARALRETDTFLSRPGIRGPSESRNLGRDLARGGWICFLDDDDSIKPDYVAQVAKHLTGQAIFYGNSISIHENVEADGNVSVTSEQRRSLAKHDLSTIEVQNFIPVGSFFLPTSLARRVDFDPHLPSHEDWDYLLRLYAIAPFKHIDVWGACYHHQTGGASRNTTNRGDRLADYLTIYRRNRGSSTTIKRQRAQKLAKMGLTLRARLF